MNLTAANTAIVLDSTADFPDAQDHFPNWRVVPLYVNFGTDSFKDGVDLTAHEFYERLRASPELPTTSQPSYARRRPLSVNSPTPAQESSQRAQTAAISSNAFEEAAAAIRSWLSESMISHGAMSASRSGTRSR